MVEPVAAKLLGRRSTKSKVQKFAQSSMEMLFYGAFTVFGAVIVPGQDWFLAEQALVDGLLHG